MGYYCRLQHGSKYIDLTTGAYRVEQSWRPPGTSVTALFGGGTMRSPYAGGEFIDERYEDRDINLPLQVRGTTSAETHQAVRALGAFIKRSLADHSEKLCLIYGPSDAIPYTPKYGQQFYKYEIKALLGGDIGGRYGIAEVRSKLIELSIPLRLAPFAVGELQRVGSATGGILEHNWATPDGGSRGLWIPSARTNEVTNPYFGHATWNTGWAEGANIIEAKNTDKEFVFLGSNSAKLTANDSSNNTYTTTVTVAASTAVFGFVVKKPDKSAVVAADLGLQYGGNVLDENIISLGDGWYMVWDTDTGTGAGANLILYVASGQTLYLGYAFAEVGTYPTAPLHGNMIDCSWGGTPHESDSTRTVARWRISSADVCDIGEFTAIFAVRHNVASASLAANAVLFAQDGGFIFYYDYSNTYWVLTDSTNAITSSVDTYTAGSIDVLAITVKSTSMKIYLNGAAIATGTDYTPPTLPAYSYLGSWHDGAQMHCEDTFLDFVTYARALTATEILNHYNDNIRHYSGGDGLGQALNPIPWLWTDDGDDTLDNNTDSTHENWAIIGGVPGNVQARSSWIFATDSFDVRLWILMSSFPWEFLRDHDDLFYIEASGTVDAGASGGAHYDIATPTGLPRNSISITVPNPEVINGTVHFFVRAKHQTTAGNVSVGRFISYVNGYIQDVDKTIAVTTTYKWFYIGNLRFLDNPEMRALTNVIPSLNFGSAIAASNLWIDFGEAFCGDMLTVDPISTDIPGGGGSATAPTNVFITDKQARFENGTYTPDLNGDIISVTPNRANMLVLYKANDAGDHSLSSYFGVTLNITPRWLLV